MIPLVDFQRVMRHFNGDKTKTFKWFADPHPRLDNKSPIQLIKLGRAKEVNKIIDTLKESYV